MKRWIVWAAVCASALACSCTRPAPATAQALHNRAAFELGCADLMLVKIDDQSAGVWGCGRRVIYQETCENDRCHWVIEREVPPPVVYTTQTIPVAPNEPIVRKSDEWRARIPALAEDQPGF